MREKIRPHALRNRGLATVALQVDRFEEWLVLILQGPWLAQSYLSGRIEIGTAALCCCCPSKAERGVMGRIPRDSVP